MKPPAQPTTEFYNNELYIFLKNNGRIVCDVNAEFENVNGERYPIKARRLRQGDVLSDGSIINNILWEQGPPGSFIGESSWRTMINNHLNMTRILEEHRIESGNKFDLNEFLTKESSWCGMRVIRGYAVISYMCPAGIGWIICGPDQGTMKGKYRTGIAADRIEFEKHIIEVIEGKME
jgi:hypothetical protein